MAMRKILVAVACAVGMGGCSCSATGIEGRTDASTDVITDAITDAGAEMVSETCGNGVVEEGEECDDGNADDCDGCSSACRWRRALQVDDDVPGAYVEAGGYPCLACPYTVETWFRLDEEDSGVEFFRMLQLASMVAGTTEYPDLIFLRDLWGGTSTDPRSPDIGIPIVPGAWHHHAVDCWVRSGVRHTAIFFDGVQWASGTLDRDHATTPVCTDVMTILGEQREVEPYPLRAATIDDLRISDEGLYTSSFTPDRHLGVRPDTVALWSFDQATDDVIPDVSGNGHDAVLVNGTFVPDDCHLP